MRPAIMVRVTGWRGRRAGSRTPPPGRLEEYLMIAGARSTMAESFSLQGIVAPPIAGSLLTGSLSDETVLRATEATPDLALLPDAHVLKLGGQSLIDRGRTAL